jgi:hypothetical protein
VKIIENAINRVIADYLQKNATVYEYDEKLP